MSCSKLAARQEQPARQVALLSDKQLQKGVVGVFDSLNGRKRILGKMRYKLIIHWDVWVQHIQKRINIYQHVGIAAANKETTSTTWFDVVSVSGKGGFNLGIFTVSEFKQHVGMQMM